MANPRQDPQWVALLATLHELAPATDTLSVRAVDRTDNPNRKMKKFQLVEKAGEEDEVVLRDTRDYNRINEDLRLLVSLAELGMLG